jgi:arylsulfatase A-like enzyme
MSSNGAKPARPNILIILNDDMGFSDIGCYGGEIQTPNLDRLAQNGLRYSQFYNTARCSPSRASLLTGLHPHQTGIGILTYDTGPEGYAGDLNRRCVTIAEVLSGADYRSYLSGKWHVAKSLTEPTESWPLQRGFDEFCGTIIGAGSFYHPNTLTRGNDNIEHEAEQDPAFSTPTRSTTRLSRISASIRPSTPTSPSSSMSRIRRRIGRSMRMRRMSPSTEAASTRAGTGFARSAWPASSNPGSFTRPGS